MEDNTGTVDVERLSSRSWSGFLAWLSVVLVLAVSALFASLLWAIERSIDTEVRTRAKSIAASLNVAREWNASYGGVFVERHPGTADDPHLRGAKRVPESGMAFTRKTPELMSREISELAARHALFRVRITSLKPMNPVNAPDAFEREALRAFEGRSAREATGRERSDDGAWYRYLEPLYVRESCLECHSAQGYAVGDVRGAISVRVNMEDAVRSVSRARALVVAAWIATSILLLWILWRLVAVQHRKLEASRAALREQAISDDLTGLRNRRYAAGRLHEEVSRAARNRRALSCILLDVDHFKRINDRHGHDAGDLVLRSIGETIRARVRTSDVVSRWGGEEFLLVLPETDLAGALELAEQLRAAISALRIPVHGTVLGVTASFGVAALQSSGPRDVDPDRLVKRADEALYSAKEGGRDRVACAA